MKDPTEKICKLLYWEAGPTSYEYKKVRAILRKIARIAAGAARVQHKKTSDQLAKELVP